MAEEPETETRVGSREDEELEIAHPEDFGIVRDSDGELLPITQPIPGLDGMGVKVKPPEPGEYEEWSDIFDDSVEETSDEETDAFLKNFIAEGIGSGGLEEVPPLMVPGLIKAVENAAGGEVFRAVEAMETEDEMATLRALQGLDGDMMGSVVEMGQELMAEEEESEETQE